MITLGIESSCDETSVAIVKGKKEILSHLTASQIEVHQQYGGVFPEIASRYHIEALIPLIEKAMEKALVSKEDLSLIGVANGPGLMGSLLMGTMGAKTLAYSWNLPLVGVNHVEAHLYSAMMGDDAQLRFPALGIVLSGGHTFLAKIDSIQHYTILGTTVDDAIGEAFDKVASMLSLPYPGGPCIEALAKEGDAKSYPFKAGNVKGSPFDFSFSGLKTHVLYTIQGKKRGKTPLSSLSEPQKKDLAASFQKAALEDIVEKSFKAFQSFPCQALYLGGGVTNNNFLKHLFKSKNFSVPLYFPPKGLSLDNGAMIAGLAAYLYTLGVSCSPFELKAFPKFSFSKSRRSL